MELKVPRGRYAQRVFWCVVVGGVGLLVLLRIFVIPVVFGTPRPSAAAFLDATFGELIAVVLGATALSGIVLYLTAPTKTPTTIDVVHARDINSILEGNLANASFWWYRGSAGRYNRARVLPHLAAQARIHGFRKVVIQVIDPRDEELCQTYAGYRHAARTGHGDDWTLSRVRRDIYATILAAYGWRESHPSLEVTVALRAESSTLRYDLNDASLVITREDPSEPAIVCPVRTFFYDTYYRDLRYTLEQAYVLDNSVRTVPIEAMDVPAARDLFAKLGLNAPTTLPDAEVRAIIAEAQADSHPYA